MNPAHSPKIKADIRMCGVKLARILVLLSIAALMALVLSRAGKGGRIAEKTSLSMGTIVQIKVPYDRSEGDRRIEAKIEQAFSEIRRVENVFSVYRANSEVSRINRLAYGQPIRISDEVFGLIEMALEYNRKTDGAFDITVKPLVDLWAEAKASGRMPKEEEVNAALEMTGSQNVILDKASKTISFKKRGVAIDLGAVAKGYATDRAIAVLKQSGIKSAIVNSGGDMYCLGMRSKKEPWTIGIQHPRDRRRLFLELKLADRAIDTSGDYEKFFVLDGKRYSHIIDPRTGYPVGDNVASATVTAADSVTADIYATALCALGPKGLDMIKKANGVDAMIVVNEGGVLRQEASPHFEERYNVSKIDL